MHTDEYEISLLRELNVCEKKIKKIKKVLAGMETKYGMKTEVFTAGFNCEKITEEKADYKIWIKEYEDLRKWEVLRDQYASLLSMMKI